MLFTVSETARLVGTSVRTLHYYDEIGLVHPASVTEAGYRLYDEGVIERLQQVLFFRSMDIPLKEIEKLLLDPSFDIALALKRHRARLLAQRQQLDALLGLMDKTIKESQVKKVVKDLQKQYDCEARERWGETESYKESKRRHVHYSEKQEQEIQAEAARIFSAFAALVGQDPAGDSAQALVKEWQEHITRYHYPCSKEILASLGQMYTADERFCENLNKYGEGNAAFISCAIAAYCK